MFWTSAPPCSPVYDHDHAICSLWVNVNCILFFSNKWDPGRLWSLWLLFLISYYYLRGHLFMIIMIIVMINYYNIILLSPCSEGAMISENFGLWTQLGRILPSVTLTKSFGYLWDLVCRPHTPPRTHVVCEKSSIGPRRPHFYYFWHFATYVAPKIG